MQKSISFIHAADLHLDSPFKGLSTIPESIFTEVRNSTFTALDNLVAVAIRKEVDFILLVGDLFDNDRQSLKAQIRLQAAFKELAKHNIAVYLSYGNHDHINGNIHPIEYPDNVFIFDGEEVSAFTYARAGEKLAEIYGFSYENRAVMEDKTVEFPRKKDAGLFSIGMLHGSLHGDKMHDPYAPFNLRSLQEKGYDYWALGHIHKREELATEPPIIYPGNTQGRHRNETGSKGCYYVSLTEGGAQTEFIETEAIVFDTIKLDLRDCETRAHIEQSLRELLNNYEEKTLVHITLTTTEQSWGAFEADGGFKELIEVLNERLMNNQQWVYVYKYKLLIENLPQIDYEDFFLGELIKTLDTISIEETIRDLYKHPQIRRFLADISQEDTRQQAKQYLLHELLRSEGGGN